MWRRWVMHFIHDYSPTSVIQELEEVKWDNQMANLKLVRLFIQSPGKLWDIAAGLFGWCKTYLTKLRIRQNYGRKMPSWRILNFRLLEATREHQKRSCPLFVLRYLLLSRMGIRHLSTPNLCSTYPLVSLYIQKMCARAMNKTLAVQPLAQFSCTSGDDVAQFYGLPSSVSCVLLK